MANPFKKPEPDPPAPQAAYQQRHHGVAADIDHDITDAEYPYRGRELPPEFILLRAIARGIAELIRRG